MKILLVKPLSLAFVLWLAVALVAPSPASAAAPRINKEELRAALDNPDVIVVDDRSGRDWTSSESKVKGAIRVAPGEEETWAARYPKDKMIVFYCA